MFKILLFIVFSISVSVSFSQTNRVVKGRVVDKQQKDQLAGVRIIVEKTKLLTTTDKDGIFSILVPDSGDYILSFQYSDYIFKKGASYFRRSYSRFRYGISRKRYYGRINR
ncbi:carboxypeptidase-like regulatory domain-containing protein [Cellulophaga baltica 4]|nr:carboxypeptidase-like regulatory domain-containing protein [Cellulophaga baltica 4]